MDSNRLGYFVVVSETGSIRRAAELLRLSPAALSKAMKQLEAEVGFKLLVPSGRGILVTDEAKELAIRAKPLLDDLTFLAKGVRERYLVGSRRRAPIKIGSFEVFTTHFLSSVLKELPEEGDLLLREVVPGEMEKALVDREIDLGITYIPIPTSGIEHQKIATLEMAIFGTKECLQKMKSKSLAEIPFVVPISPVKGSPNKVQGLDGWPDDRLPRLTQYRVTMLESALEICRKGLAVGYMPTFVVRLHNETVKPQYQLEVMPSPKNLGNQKQDIYIARRKSDLEGSLSKKIAKVIRLTCQTGVKLGLTLLLPLALTLSANAGESRRAPRPDVIKKVQKAIKQNQTVYILLYEMGSPRDKGAPRIQKHNRDGLEYSAIYDSFESLEKAFKGEEPKELVVGIPIFNLVPLLDDSKTMIINADLPNEIQTTGQELKKAFPKKS